MTHKITYHCAFCARSETVSAPTAFKSYCDGDVEDAACPDHAGAMKFLADQCPGCVSGWGSCALFMAIGNGKVGEDQLSEIRAGRCPSRVNGTMIVGAGEVREIDLSKRSAAGQVFAVAVLDAKRYVEELRAKDPSLRSR